MYLFKKSINDVRLIVKFIMVEGVAGVCHISFSFYLVRGGDKLGVWYLVQHFGDWGYSYCLLIFNRQYKQPQLPVIGTLFIIVVNLSLCHIFICKNIGIDVLY